VKKMYRKLKKRV